MNVEVEIDFGSAGSFLQYEDGYFSIDRGSTNAANVGDYTIKVILIPFMID